MEKAWGAAEVIQGTRRLRRKKEEAGEVEGIGGGGPCKPIREWVMSGQLFRLTHRPEGKHE